jgi:hypothetical protein
MRTTCNTIIIAIIALLVCLPLAAQTEGEGSGQAPAFGPPSEMSQVAMFIGTWKYHGEMRMDSAAQWTRHEATVVFSLVCGGAVLQEDFTGPMMGMEMKGLSLTGYDRETKKWQTVWTDNFGGRISYYEGDFKDGKLVTSGKDMGQGKTVFTRTTYSDITDKGMKWTMENSVDGQTWFTSMRGTYTKQ